MHGVFTVSSAISAAFSVDICDTHGCFNVSSSAISAVFSVNICGVHGGLIVSSFVCLLRKFVTNVNEERQ